VEGNEDLPMKGIGGETRLVMSNKSPLQWLPVQGGSPQNKGKTRKSRHRSIVEM